MAVWGTTLSRRAPGHWPRGGRAALSAPPLARCSGGSIKHRLPHRTRRVTRRVRCAARPLVHAPCIPPHRTHGPFVTARSVPACAAGARRVRRALHHHARTRRRDGQSVARPLGRGRRRPGADAHGASCAMTLAGRVPRRLLLTHGQAQRIYDHQAQKIARRPPPPSLPPCSTPYKGFASLDVCADVILLHLSLSVLSSRASLTF